MNIWYLEGSLFYVFDSPALRIGIICFCDYRGYLMADDVLGKQSKFTMPIAQLFPLKYPCPCNYYQDAVEECTCLNSVITRFQKRISGPMLDCLDIHIKEPRVDYEKLSDDRLGEPSANVQARVKVAHVCQYQLFTESSSFCSANLHPAQIR